MNSEIKNYLSIRIKQARKMAGMSLQELSDSLNNLVSKQALSKYEQGAMNPTNEVLIALSKSLNVKPEYFLKKEILNLSNISFRKKTTLLKNTEESIIEKAKDYVERFLELESILGIKSTFVNPLSKLVIKDKNDTSKAASLLRDNWNLGNNPIPSLIETLELNGVKVLLIDEVDEIDGFSFLVDSSIPVVIVNTNSKPIERIRFTLIHELAHILLNFDNKHIFENKEIERLCHHFASSFLIPSEKLIAMIGGLHRSYINIKELISIKEYYGVSIRATVHRLLEIEVISQTYYQRWMIYMSKTYGQKSEPGKYVGDERLRLFEQLMNRALAEDFISLSKAASLMNVSINKIRKDIASVR